MLASPKMNRISIWVLIILLFPFLHTTNSVEELVRESLINFYQKLSNSNSPPNPAFGWNSTSDPCKDQWKGVICNNRTLSVKRIQLDGLNFTGTFDASTLCNMSSLAASLTTISLNDNSLGGDNLEEISKCKQLTRFYIGNNRFSGNLPDSLSSLNNLKGLNVSWNNFNGIVPDMSRISGLQEFLVQNNQLTGPIPNFDLLNFMQFNVSFNNFTGPIPNGGSKFPASSFIGNPDLCGQPLSKQCPPSDDRPNKSNSISRDKALMFLGYFLIVFTLFLIIIVKVCKKNKTKQERVDLVYKVASVDDGYFNKTSANSEENKSEILEASADHSGVVSSTLIVLTSPEVNGLKFDDLLRAPAELLGRGKHGTMYKVICEKGMILAVKRIRDWAISTNDFKQRMRRLDQVKHPNVLPSIAFYCSNLEKLLVYEYQQNGSLFKLLHGTQTSQAFDWSSRLGTAATITTALAFMHQELLPDHIAHGNLKSSNILLNNNMEPCITEYGLMVMDNIEAQPPTLATSINSAFKVDIYGLGVILLELLTGKMAQKNGLDLAKWVLSVVREEWTVEVFDKRLIQEGASEERMVNLLQIAVKCVNRSPEARPNINQVAVMINTIREEEERSMVSEP